MAQHFTLSLDIDPTSVSAFRTAGARLALAKPAGTLPPNVVWLTCEPRRRITITWEEIYGIYGSAVPLHDGAPIHVIGARYPASDRALHPFVGDRFIAPFPSERIPSGHYDVVNQAPFAAAFGLLQTAKVNGTLVRSPVNVSVLAPGSAADFVAVAAVYVWIGPSTEAGSASAHLPASAELVAFTADQTVRRYRYEPARSGFAPVSPQTIAIKDEER